MRCFLAFSLEKEGRALIEKSQREIGFLKAPEAIKPNQLHLTYVFFGNLEPHQVPRVIAVVKEMSKTLDPFALHVGDLQYLPPRGQPRIIIIPLLNVDSQLFSTRQMLLQKLTNQKISFDTKAWYPHITVARTKTNVRHALPKTMGKPVYFKRIVLYQSVLSHTGSTYTKLYEFPL